MLWILYYSNKTLSWIKQQQERRAETGDDQQHAYILESDCQLVVQVKNEARSILSPVGVVRSLITCRRGLNTSYKLYKIIAEYSDSKIKQYSSE